ncbi:hypothetical protein [Cellulomonas fimi]|uniref:Uncharacterized protein n=1 Tax=Cellulomonas fimi TaxID=1708 RepID=A0A7Y0LY60_CELFI|nr:hypothetical protein [Cellulomonas fimi]NMR20230.1 hypothetical protein [Cellulomonas fimi]
MPGAPFAVGPVPSELAPKKKRGLKVFLWIVVGVVLLIIAIAALSGGGEDSTAGTSADAAPGAASGAEGGAAGSDESTTPEVNLAEFAAVDAAGWALIAKDPDAAAGQKIVIFAEVTQFDSATGADTFRANAGATQPAAEYELETNAVFGGEADLLAAITQGDVLRVYAEVSGSLEYETAIGGAMTVPALEVVSAETVGYLDISGDAVLGTPVWGEYGGVDLPVTITNSANATMSYTVEIVAVSADGAVQHGTASAYAENLAPGQAAVTEASFFEDLPQDAVINVVEVERYTS